MSTQTAPPKFRPAIIYLHDCLRCGHRMESRQERPRQCWRCKRRDWDKLKA